MSPRHLLALAAFVWSAPVAAQDAIPAPAVPVPTIVIWMPVWVPPGGLPGPYFIPAPPMWQGRPDLPAVLPPWPGMPVTVVPVQPIQPLAPVAPVVPDAAGVETQPLGAEQVNVEVLPPLHPSAGTANRDNAASAQVEPPVPPKPAKRRVAKPKAAPAKSVRRMCWKDNVLSPCP